jgi:hypothetical protein
VKLWLPVWIAYQGYINSPNQEQSRVYSQEQYSIGSRSNPSYFSVSFEDEFETITKTINPGNHEQKIKIDAEKMLQQYLKQLR